MERLSKNGMIVCDPFITQVLNCFTHGPVTVAYSTPVAVPLTTSSMLRAIHISLRFYATVAQLTYRSDRWRMCWITISAPPAGPLKQSSYKNVGDFLPGRTNSRLQKMLRQKWSHAFDYQDICDLLGMWSASCDCIVELSVAPEKNTRGEKLKNQNQILLESTWRDLSDLHPVAPLQFQNSIVSAIPRQACFLQVFAKFHECYMLPFSFFLLHWLMQTWWKLNWISKHVRNCEHIKMRL